MSDAAEADDASRLDPAPGRFLVSSPRLLDPNFMHTVVLVCDHGPAGTYGLIVNRPGSVRLSDLGSDRPLLLDRHDRVFFGGPVAVEQMQLLHRLGVAIPGSTEVIPGVQMGGDAEVLASAIGDAGEDLVRFIVGYSGWGAGQLEGEMAEGAWVVCEAESRFVFDPDPDTVWRRVLRARGGVYARLADEPPDPSWN